MALARVARSVFTQWWCGSLAVVTVACGGGEAPSTASDRTAHAMPGRDQSSSKDDDIDIPSTNGVDFGAISHVYPAYKPPVPQVMSGGGKVMPTVDIVPIFVGENDPLQKDAMAFMTKFAASDAWPQMVGEYGVGAAHVRPALTDLIAPDTDSLGVLEDQIIQPWLASLLDGTHAEIGPTDTSALQKTVYVLFFPQSTTIGNGGNRSCGSGGFGGYHSEVELPNDQRASYIVIPRCGETSGRTVTEQLTYVVSHELVEAATDPFPLTGPAFSQVDAVDIAWSFFFAGGEIGDMCQDDASSQVTPSDLGGYTLQRSWSNASMRQYHDPCVPIPANNPPYFNSAMVLDHPVTARVNGQLETVRGITVAKGESKTVDVVLFSDAETDGPWTIEAFDALALHGLKSTLDVSLDRTRGRNGEKVHLTITVKDRPVYSANAVLLVSTLGTRKTQWIGFVEVP